MLPQVLAGLGALSVLSAGCAIWLERLQPYFAALAGVALAYQTWLVIRRPRTQRTASVLAIWSISLAVCGMVLITWVALWFRYR